VQWLLSHGADPNIPENNGITPLMDAASGGDTAVMRVLLEHGARADLRDNFGDTALVCQAAEAVRGIGAFKAFG